MPFTLFCSEMYDKASAVLLYLCRRSFLLILYKALCEFTCRPRWSPRMSTAQMVVCVLRPRRDNGTLYDGLDLDCSE